MPTCSLVLLFFLCARTFAQDAVEIVRRSVERDWTDFDSLKNYTYEENSELRQLSKAGTVTSRRRETREILILAGRPYDRLLARDGRPLSEGETRKEQEKLDREAARRGRESPADRARIEKERAEERAFVREIPEAFTLRLLGVEEIGGQPAWAIEAVPKAGYRPAHSRAKILTRLRARLWIEQSTYHWVKVDAEALDTLSFGLGLLRVAPGGTLHFEQTRVNDEIWLPSIILIHADARLALVKKLRAELDIRYSGYRKFQSDSTFRVEN